MVAGKSKKTTLRDHYYAEIHDYNIDVDDFAIYLVPYPTTYYDGDIYFSEPGVEYQMSGLFIKNLHILTRLDPERPILVHMKTCGGSWEEGMAIYDSIRACPNPVVILSYTYARSMSSIILQAADKRVLMPHSYFMIHEGTYGDEGTFKGAMTRAEFSLKSRDVMLDLYANHLKKRGAARFRKMSLERLKHLLQNKIDEKEDFFFTAKEAVGWGFADEIFGGDDGDFDWAALRDV
ncbi:MAG: ATP-dependent Clp protease proteolytic subunit [Candidatus Spechtbacterales bacterium]